MKIVIKSIKFSWRIIPINKRIKALGLGALLFVNSLLELLGIGAIIPLILVLLEDNLEDKYPRILSFFEILNISDVRYLLVVFSIFFFIIILVKNIATILISKYNAKFSYEIFGLLTLKLHEYYYSKGFLYFKQNNSNKIVRDVRMAPERFSQSFVMGNLNLLNEFFVLVMIVISLLFFNWKIFLLLVVSILPTYVIFYGWVRKKIVVIGEKRSEIEPIIGINLFQSIFGFVDIVITRTEDTFRRRIGKSLQELVRINIKTTVYNLLPPKISEVSLMLGVTIIVSFGLFMVPSKEELIKLLGLFGLAGYRLIPSINRIMTVVNNLNLNVWVFDVMAPLITYEKGVPKEVVAVEFENVLELSNVSFSYDGSSDEILRDLSLHIKKGEVIGLVGPSGSGKTTVMNLMLRLLEPSQGQYKIDGKTLSKEYDSSFHEKVGYVQQQVYLLDAPIYENIAFGSEESDLDRVKLDQVLKQSSLWDFVANLPEGINTVIGENGAMLSGGQRQRIGIARALYCGAEILFFDEATSSLDYKTEKDITDAINSLADGRLTIILIAHRLSTLERCDRIIELV